MASARQIAANRKKGKIRSKFERSEALAQLSVQEPHRYVDRPFYRFLRRAAEDQGEAESRAAAASPR